MAVISGTNFANPTQANGYVGADGFLGAPSSTDIAQQRLSTTPASFPNGSSTAGADIYAITTVAAAGATQGTATQIPATAAQVNVTVTASTEGVKLPAIQVGLVITLYTPTTKGYKVYAGVAGQVINANTTATTAYAMTTNHPATFTAIDATHWRVQRGN